MYSYIVSRFIRHIQTLSAALSFCVSSVSDTTLKSIVSLILLSEEEIPKIVKLCEVVDPCHNLVIQY